MSNALKDALIVCITVDADLLKFAMESSSDEIEALMGPEFNVAIFSSTMVIDLSMDSPTYFTLSVTNVCKFLWDFQ